MLLKFLCKAGSLQLDENGTLSVVAPFNKPVWSIPLNSITKITTHPGTIATVNITIHTQQSQYVADTVTKANYERLLPYLQNIETQAVGSEWYLDPRKLTHVASYDNEKQMQKEVELAMLHGWSIGGQTGTAGHVNIGRTTTAAVLTGGLSLMLGASRTKDKITVTYIRK